MLILDDFEQEQPWEMKEWGDPARLSLDRLHASQGSQALLVDFAKAAGTPHPKGIVLRRSLLGRAMDYHDFLFDIFVETSAPLRLDVSVDADRSYEAPSITLQPGWNRNVGVSLISGKCQAWDQDAGAVELNPELAIGSLVISLHREVNEAGRVYLDNIRSQYRPEMQLTRPQAQIKLDHTLRLLKITPSAAKVSTYQPLELTVDLNADVLDPYDADEFELKALFTSPQGRVVEVPGFLYSGDVSPTSVVQNAVWKIRFTPTQLGAWTYVVTAKNRWQRARSDELKLKVVPGSNDGFVRIDPIHPQYFAFDSGRFYYPIGQNVAWLPFRDYERYFAKMSRNGENWARIWMTNWSFGIEWKPMGQYHGLGFYNLSNAKKLDELLGLAGASGIYLQLVFDFHGALSSKVNPEWSNNPYNVINGGFLVSPEQFFTDPRAKELYKKRLRYIIARWGYSPYVMAWELFNEVSFTDSFNEEAVSTWHQEMAGYVKQHDPYQHLTTTSYGGDAKGEAYTLPVIDFAQHHIYAQNIFKQMQSINSKMSQYNKPHFIGEFGSDSANGKDDQDRSGVFLLSLIFSTICCAVALSSQSHPFLAIALASSLAASHVGFFVLP
jgi:hypothetical protein